MSFAEATTKEMKVFANPLRLQILQTIASAGSISFTELRDELQLTDGSLYYHLKMLAKYIEKDEQNFYRLNGEGRAILNRLVHKISKLEVSQSTQSSKQFLNVLGVSQLHYYLLGDRVRSLIELHSLLFIIAWLFGVTYNYFSAFETIFTGGAIVNALISVVHWYFYLLLIYLLLKTFKRPVHFIELWIVVLVGILPYLLYLLPVGLVYYLNIALSPAVAIVLNILFFVCKFWSTLIVAKGISLASDISEAQGLLIAIVLIILDYFYLLISL
ncbi:MAG: DUF7347 domain-containing protein [Candidatus Heimdallarchaeaceae archaeon]